MTKEELTARINQVFINVQYPGDHNITIHPLGLDECIEDYFRGKAWQECTIGGLRLHVMDALGLFTPQGYHYYLPAFLIATLGSEHDFGWYIGYSLERGDQSSTIKNKTKEQLFLERMQLFSKEQLETLIDFFQYLIKQPYETAADDYETVIINILDYLDCRK